MVTGGLCASLKRNVARWSSFVTRSNVHIGTFEHAIPIVISPLFCLTEVASRNFFDRFYNFDTFSRDEVDDRVLAFQSAICNLRETLSNIEQNEGASLVQDVTKFAS